MEIVFVPLAPYLAGAEPTEVSTTWDGRQFHIAGYRGLSNAAFQDSIEGVLAEIRRFPKHGDATQPDGWRIIEWAV
jgi:hypothetical protein